MSISKPRLSPFDMLFTAVIIVAGLFAYKQYAAFMDYYEEGILLATVAALAFLILIAWPAYEYAYEESYITTPALQIPNVWRAAALPVGIALMALFAFLRLARSGNVRTMVAAILSVALVIAIFWLLRGTLKPLGNLNLIIFFVGVAGFCVFAGVPIA
ncbi:MAG: TRAP transporter small permease, partial [Burkholderiales bacterium]|nr:TRAP transporter small permease [Burkholderiales bacterium]